MKKIFATIVCVCSFVGIIISSFLIQGCSNLPKNKDGYLKKEYERIAQEYSEALLENLKPSDRSTYGYLDKTNLDYAIIKSAATEREDVDMVDASKYLCNYHSIIPNYTYAYRSEDYVIEGEKEAEQTRLMQDYRYIYDLVYEESEELYYFDLGDEYILATEFGTYNGKEKKHYTLTDIGGVLDYKDQNGEFITITDFMTIQEIYLGEEDILRFGHRSIDLTEEGVAEQIGPQREGYVYNHCYYFGKEPQVTRYYFWIFSSLDLEKGYNDDFAKVTAEQELLRNIRDIVIPSCVAFTMMFLVSMGYLVLTAGHRKGKQEIYLRMVDKIPFIVYVFVVVSVIALCYQKIELEIVWMDMKTPLLLAVIGFFLLAFVLSTIVRIKAKCFWKYTLYHYVKNYKAIIYKMMRDMPRAFWKIAGIFIGISVIELILLIVVMIISSLNLGIILFIFSVLKIAEILFASIIVRQTIPIQEASEKIAAGDFEKQIITQNLFGGFKTHAEYMNAAAQGIATAVEEQVKSECFRTELITNVSQKIKMPLSSIIHYIELLREENLQKKEILEYIDILERQSLRLGKLVEDLEEVSMATTGSLKMQLEECDVVLLLEQLTKEFENKIKQNQLEIVMEHEKDSISIMADSRYLWRVLQNLMNNICKYSISNSRVYISSKVFDDIVQIKLNNISKSKLEISGEELMERFVRGDSSRNTEGNGLGLSIAKSLTELMGGSIHLIVDGDMFQVTLEFPYKNFGGEYV